MIMLEVPFPRIFRYGAEGLMEPFRYTMSQLHALGVGQCEGSPQLSIVLIVHVHLVQQNIRTATTAGLSYAGRQANGRDGLDIRGGDISKRNMPQCDEKVLVTGMNKSVDISRYVGVLAR